MKVIIDRFEGDFAVVELENETFVNMPRHLIPPDAKEGSVLSINIDHSETKKREAEIAKLMNDFFKK